MADITGLGVEVLTGEDELERASHDLWAVALLRGAPRPAAVARPTSTEGVARVLRWATETRTPVVPRGLGSGVSGAAQAVAGCVVLDLSRLDRVVAVEEDCVVVQAGVRGSTLEEALAAQGLTVGHYPQSLALSSVGGWIATASSGQASAGFGSIEDVLLGLTFVLADGTVVRLRPTPRSAVGPDLRRLLVGSEGTLGVVTEAVLATAPLPEWTWATRRAESFAEVLRLAREATGAAIVRGYDETDALLAFGAAGHEGGCLLLLGFAGRGGGSDPLGEHWWAHRNDTARLYEAIMGPERAWGAGVIVESFELAGLWRDLPGLYDGVRAALAEHADPVACHVSHPYRAGASLYFTFLIRAADDEAALAAYERAWRDGAAACLAERGTLSHHHGVGLLKAPFVEAELGAGLEVLRRVKAALDPEGILNPGKLLG